MEVIVGVLLAARMCDEYIDPTVRAIIAVVGTGIDPRKYPVHAVQDPIDHDLREDDGITALVEILVRIPAGEILSTDSQTDA
ncbi:hypothetical protein JL101_025325 [Skermanella rosea]|uniref:hypothetical protein n=1 Tax=Skermanella rosea TaxID=1817965 RepID=UPI0019341A99|nr:hypothetical protein [Skermanella rosea]UEM03252.1 hypothetical protein JL101_025325 [Skermanella rosea]